MSIFKRIFWNSLEKRLRAGWRILVYTLMWIFAPLVVAHLIGDWLALPLISVFPTVAGVAPHAVAILLRLLVVLLVTWLAAWLIDRRTVREYGLWFDRSWWLDFGFGLALGALLMAFIFVVEWLAGWVVVVAVMEVSLPGVTFWTAILGALLLFIVVGITEELLARGYHLRNLAEGLNFRGVGARGALFSAWLLSSSFFGLLHVFNPNATWYSTVALMAAGLFLGIGFVLTGSLAIPIGLHITWNFFQGNVFGFPVSGNTFESATLISIQQEGPPLWTGGAFGPEAGLLGMIAIGLGSILTLIWVRWRYGHVQLSRTLAEYRRYDVAAVQLVEQQESGD
jgi:membrane protease YdiL (CAAX protease family)